MVYHGTIGRSCHRAVGVIWSIPMIQFTTRAKLAMGALLAPVVTLGYALQSRAAVDAHIQALAASGTLALTDAKDSGIWALGEWVTPVLIITVALAIFFLGPKIIRRMFR